MNNPEGLLAGPSTSARRRDVNASTPPTPPTAPDTLEIPSYGLEFFEFRRRCFLANTPIPSTPSDEPLPPSYIVSTPLPDPVPPLPRRSAPSSSVGKLETLLDEPGSEANDLVWKAGVATVNRNLTNGKRFARPLKLSLVIKILRAGWLRDGTWPMDPKTKQPIPPPDSPPLPPTDLDPNPHPNGTGYDAEGSRRSTGDELPESYKSLMADVKSVAALAGRRTRWDVEPIVGDDDLHVGTDVWRGGEPAETSRMDVSADHG